jgi:hypothetical protein
MTAQFRRAKKRSKTDSIGAVTRAEHAKAEVELHVVAAGLAQLVHAQVLEFIHIPFLGIARRVALAAATSDVFSNVMLFTDFPPLHKTSAVHSRHARPQHPSHLKAIAQLEKNALRALARKDVCHPPSGNFSRMAFTLKRSASFPIPRLVQPHVPRESTSDTNSICPTAGVVASTTQANRCRRLWTRT